MSTNLVVVAAVAVLLLTYLSFAIISYREPDPSTLPYDLLAFGSLGLVRQVASMSEITDQPGLHWGIMAAMVFTATVIAVKIGRYFRRRTKVRTGSDI
ncbi:hypothetical protein AB0C65_36040 [Nocardia sp. NPDC048505]|uniref:hypothetical protein n=1 Tax=Nocardia sp. NPDC048505 TaxID=3155756 RepID=UPI00340A2072